MEPNLTRSESMLVFDRAYICDHISENQPVGEK